MIKRFFKVFLMIVGGITLLTILSGIVAGIVFWVTREEVSDKTFLKLGFKKGLIEYSPNDPRGRMVFGRQPTVLDLVETLQRASEDDRVKGIVANLSHARMGFARIQEIRNAILNFRKAGKTAIAYADSFGEFGPGNRPYYLATAFEKIYLQPSGDICLTGLMIETRFLKGTLEKLGIVPRLDHRHEYKNAMNIFTEDKYTQAHKEAVSGIMESVFGQMVEDIAQARKLSEENVISLTDTGIFFGQEAVNAKLADGLAYPDQVYETIKKEVGEDVGFVSLWDYLDEAGSLHTEGETIALIYGVGKIQRGASRYDPIFGDMAMGSDTMTKAFRSAIEDDEVKAILFRINSPGGSYVASDSIWRETVRAKEAGKPVIVSMGDMAGSGGYFIAMSADKIVAQPATITGSIGVISGKVLTSGLWEKLGISWDEVHSSQNSTMWTGTHDYTPLQWNLLQSELDRIYADFTSKVSRGRGLPINDVLRVAKGRIWSGRDAKERGLVDELGGFPKAVALAKTAAGIPEEKPICLKLFPEKKSLMESLLEEGSVRNEDMQRLNETEQILQVMRPLLRSLRELEIINEGGILSVQGIEWSP